MSLTVITKRRNYEHLLAAVTIKSPQDLLPFLERRIDPERHFWIVTIIIPHAIVRGEATSLRQANAAMCEIMQPAMVAHNICKLVKWAVERPMLSGKQPGMFPVQRTLSAPTISFFMEHMDRLLDSPFPDPSAFKKLLERLRKEGVTFTVEAKSRMWLQ